MLKVGITEAVKTLQKNEAFFIECFFSNRNQICSFYTVKAADGLPELDPFHDTDALSTNWIQDKVMIIF